jgi:PAS domain S-box-containing protein
VAAVPISRTDAAGEIEKELRADKQRLELALVAATEGYWDWNLATGAVVLSPHWLEMLGHLPGEIEPQIQILSRLIHREDRPRTLDRMRAHLEGLTPLYESEYRVATGSGKWRWHLLRGRVVERDAAGKPLRMLGVNIDIGRQKRAEAESEVRSEQLRKLALELALSQERERRRIAAGLHDEVGQILAVARAKLGQLMETGGGTSRPRPARSAGSWIAPSRRSARSPSS